MILPDFHWLGGQPYEDTKMIANSKVILECCVVWIIYYFVLLVIFAIKITVSKRTSCLQLGIFENFCHAAFVPMPTKHISYNP